jgi:hypothetical protein
MHTCKEHVSIKVEKMKYMKKRVQNRESAIRRDVEGSGCIPTRYPSMSWLPKVVTSYLARNVSYVSEDK